MTRPKKTILIFSGLILLFLAGAISFVFNPLGLGPEPDSVLSREFLSTPAEDLSGLELLIDGKAAFEKVIFAIEAARKSIYIQTFIWKDGEIGRHMVRVLKDSADRGVAVTIRKDLLGTVFELGDMIKGRPSPVFTKSGLKDYPKISVDNDLFADTDHSKYFIIDSQMAIFGGMNIADEYHKQWHDYMVAIRGDRLTEAFELKAVQGAAWPESSPFFVAVNDRNATEIRTALIQIIDHAAERIIVEHAYFSDDRIIAALRRAAQRGVAVDVVLPKHPDTHVYANRVTINKLMAGDSQSAPRIYLYPRMSHAKVVMVDGVIASVGSANLTPRSMVTSKELTLFVQGPKEDPFISKLRNQLESNIRECEQVTKPFNLDFIERVMAVAGKYIW